jgi:hypothetical protein
LQREQDNRDCLAHRFRIMEARVGVEENQGQKGEEADAGKKTGTPFEEWRWRIFHLAAGAHSHTPYLRHNRGKGIAVVPKPAE